MSLSDGTLAVDLVGVGGHVDLHVPLGPYFLVGARARFERRSVGALEYDATLFSEELDAGSMLDLAVVAQARLVTGRSELGLGVGFGPSRLAFRSSDEWGYAVDPHLSFRAGSVVAFTMGLGFLIRRWPASRVSEVGFHASMGLSFLLWSHR